MRSEQALRPLPSPRPATLPAARRTLRRCLVCGFAEVRTDEVVDRGVLLLASCPHCDHRWTERLADESLPAPAAPLHVRRDRPAA